MYSFFHSYWNCLIRSIQSSFTDIETFFWLLSLTLVLAPLSPSSTLLINLQLIALLPSHYPVTTRSSLTMPGSATFLVYPYSITAQLLVCLLFPCWPFGTHSFFKSPFKCYLPEERVSLFPYLHRYSCMPVTTQSHCNSIICEGPCERRICLIVSVSLDMAQL